MTDQDKLRHLAEIMSRAIWDVNGIVTKGEAHELDRLRRKLGKDWDAVNRRWIDYTE